MHAAGAAGDPEAIAWWHAILPPGECFLCGANVASPGEGPEKVAILGHPADGDKALALRYCAACWALPPMYRAARELRMLRAVWPNAGWRLQNGLDLRRRRCSQPRPACRPVATTPCF
jgi:hypothetical protein